MRPQVVFKTWQEEGNLWALADEKHGSHMPPAQGVRKNRWESMPGSWPTT
jgi:hypothetical protein